MLASIKHNRLLLFLAIATLAYRCCTSLMRRTRGTQRQPTASQAGHTAIVEWQHRHTRQPRQPRSFPQTMAAWMSVQFGKDEELMAAVDTADIDKKIKQNDLSITKREKIAGELKLRTLAGIVTIPLVIGIGQRCVGTSACAPAQDCSVSLSDLARYFQ
ncbi:uncharacterized protein M421DRAFT_166427 [Didymella exigua CBS 183.55]|uniref:Uncharacterized protein n=1 Tax=Didymella exigua CBS 183.55 TaxID=1150837 RepID=A0A6A5RLN7_9PLEO|nr:uncharacterized protein M421DRAFT_166427 [Didymella exigua CBS 183.55]KAF1928018.1 hypothetical protein M421DRAFT_166427 [Didymella exigua CBS 183.55]